MPSIALYTGNFNPPGLHHRAVAAALAEAFDEVVVAPHGATPENPLATDTPPRHRAWMADLAFRGLPRVSVDLADLENGVRTPDAALAARFAARGEPWLVMPAEALRGGGPWGAANLVVVHRPERPPAPADLPPRFRLLPVPEWQDLGAAIRAKAVNNEPLAGLVAPEVVEYIHRQGLFRHASTLPHTRRRFERPRLQLECDPRSAKARALAEKLRPLVGEPAEMIVALGGDGTMLRAIRQHWRRRLPFFGINTGHLGFLLNDTADLPFPGDALLYQLPLLWVQFETPDGPRGGLAFNDAWVERTSGQTAWLGVTVDGEARMPKVVADGLLVSTAAGSTSYARAMGAPPLPFHAPLLLLVGSNVLSPPSWKCAALGIDSEMSVRTLDPEKRPLLGYLDGEPIGRTLAMHARASRSAAVELAFVAAHNPADKLARLQFPSGA